MKKIPLLMTLTILFCVLFANIVYADDVIVGETFHIKGDRFGEAKTKAFIDLYKGYNIFCHIEEREYDYYDISCSSFDEYGKCLNPSINQYTVAYCRYPLQNIASQGKWMSDGESPITIKYCTTSSINDYDYFTLGKGDVVEFEESGKTIQLLFCEEQLPKQNFIITINRLMNSMLYYLGVK